MDKSTLIFTVGCLVGCCLGWFQAWVRVMAKAVDMINKERNLDNFRRR